jgi:hypothetical protein
MTKDVKELLARAGTKEQIAQECDVQPIAVYRWGQNDSIPAKHLAGVLRVANRNKAGITAEILCAVHDRSPTSVTPSHEVS